MQQVRVKPAVDSSRATAEVTNFSTNTLCVLLSAAAPRLIHVTRSSTRMENMTTTTTILTTRDMSSMVFMSPPSQLQGSLTSHQMARACLSCHRSFGNGYFASLRQAAQSREHCDRLWSDLAVADCIAVSHDDVHETPTQEEWQAYCVDHEPYTAHMLHNCVVCLQGIQPP